MRSAYLPGTRSKWLLLAAAALVLPGLAAGCGSSKPAYFTAASQLKTSVTGRSGMYQSRSGGAAGGDSARSIAA
jgi:hypothetical protein